MPQPSAHWKAAEGKNISPQISKDARQGELSPTNWIQVGFQIPFLCGQRTYFVRFRSFESYWNSFHYTLYGVLGEYLFTLENVYLTVVRCRVLCQLG